MTPLCGNTQAYEDDESTVAARTRSQVDCQQCDLIWTVLAANVLDGRKYFTIPFVHKGNFSLAALYFAYSILGTTPSRDPATMSPGASIWAKWCAAGTFEYLKKHLESGKAHVGCRSCGSDPVNILSRICMVCEYVPEETK